MKNGFTLVELSIVLVIIGLLIGGILVGQSLINTAKLNKVVSDLRQYEAAAMQFYSKFKRYPGDAAGFAPAGNKNGYLDGTNTCIDGYYAMESTQVWGHLSQAKMLSKNYEIFSPSSLCGGTHNINYRWQGQAGVLSPYTETTKQVSYDVSSGKQIIYATHYDGGNFHFNFSLDPYEALSVENKLSATPIVYPYKETGATNASGTLGMCFDATTEGFIACTDPIAQAANLIYILPKQ